MNTLVKAIYRTLFHPLALLTWAIGMTAGFGFVHALGWREFTTVLSGTIPLGASEAEAALKAGAYLATYLGAVLAAPVLALAAGISFVLERWVRTW